jgi:hypothetical protein
MAEGSFTFDGNALQPLPNPYARISELATRLGVKPVEFGRRGTVTMTGADGNAYDVWDVAIALLDRLDNAVT